MRPIKYASIAVLAVLALAACGGGKQYPAQDNLKPRVSHLLYWMPVYLAEPPDRISGGVRVPGSGEALQNELRVLMIEYARGIYAANGSAGGSRETLMDALSRGARYAVFAEAAEEQGRGGFARPDLAVRVRVFDLQYGGLDYPVLDRTLRAEGRDSVMQGSRETAAAALVRQFMDQAYGPG